MPKTKKEESSSSDSSSDATPAKAVPTPKPKGGKQSKVEPKKEEKKEPKKEEKKPAKKQESEDSDESSSSSSEPVKKPVAKKVVAAKKKEASSSSDDSSEEAPKAKAQAKKVPEKKVPEKKAAAKAGKEKSSSDDSDSSDGESEEEAAKPQTNDKKRKADDNGNDERSAKKPKTETAASNGGAEEGTRVFLGNLNFKVDDDAIKAFFSDVGEAVDIHWVTDKATGKFYGTGFVNFATAEEAKAAVAKNGQDCLGRPIRIDFAQARGERTPNKAGAAGGRDRAQSTGNRAPTPKPPGCTTVFLGNLSFQIDEDGVRKHFADCGEISSIRWVERDGQFKGCGFVEFAESDATDKAVAKNGSDLLGRAVRVDYSAPKPPRQ